MSSFNTFELLDNELEPIQLSVIEENRQSVKASWEKLEKVFIHSYL